MELADEADFLSVVCGKMPTEPKTPKCCVLPISSSADARGRALQMLNFSINLIVPITYVPLPGMASLTQFPHFAL